MFRQIAGKKLIAVTCVLAVTGCQMPHTTPPRPNIPFFQETVAGCTAERQPFVQAQERFSERIWESAGVGALAGAGAGALAATVATGGDLTDVLAGALIGAVIGGLAGAVGSYLQQKEEQNLQRAELLQSIENDAIADGRKLTGLAASLNKLSNCRQTQIDNLVADAKASRVAKDIARSRLSAIEASVQDDNDLVAAVLDEVGERRAIYVEAAARTSGKDEVVILGDSANYSRNDVVFLKAVENELDTLVARVRSNVRSEPNKTSKKIGVLEPGAEAQSKGLVADLQWYEIIYGDRVGYVFETLLVPPGSEAIVKPEPIKVAAPKGDNGIQDLRYKEVILEAQNENSEQELLSAVDTARVLLEV